MTQPLSMYGAVDLAAAGSASASAGGDAVPGPFSVEATAANLQSVLETSARVPVVAVFFSARSEESTALAARLESLAVKSAGSFQLAKVDVDAAPEIVQAFRVSRVPAAVALLQGQPLPLFEGAPAEAELGPLIDQLLAAAAQYGITGRLDGAQAPAEPALSAHHAAGLAALEARDFAKAEEEFELALKEEPGNDDIKRGLAQARLMLRVGEVSEPLAAIESANEAPRGDVEAQLAAADVEVAFGRPDAAFTRLIAAVQATAGDERERLRERLLDLFQAVGASDPLVSQARKALASVLF